MDSFTKFIAGLGTTVLAAGVIALWSMNANFARLEERVASWTRTFENRFVVTSKKLDDYEKRIDQLEKDRFERRRSQ